MSTSIFKKFAAAVCGAATLFAMGATAMSASADGAAELSIEKVTIKMDQVNEWIPVKMYIANNPGYAASGMSYVYEVTGDLALTSRALVEDGVEDPNLADYTTGDAAAGEPYINRNEEKGIVGYSSAAQKNNTKNDWIMEAYFKIKNPDAAKPGNVYPIKMTVKQFCDKGSNDLAYTTVDGYIMIEEEVTTSSETSTSATTTSTTESETTASETTASSNTTASAATTTSSAAATTTSSAAATTTSTAKPSQTGDAGVGVVVATLIAAAGAAVVLRKKED